MNARAETILGFASGYGQSDTHIATLTDGRPNPSSQAGQPYEQITGKQILGMVKNPPSAPKEKARWFIPSTYSASDARSHEAQRLKGNFFWLPLDVDQNNLPLSDIFGAVHAVLPDSHCIIYSSRSATEENRKWRALVPLRDTIPGSDYPDTLAAFYDLLETASDGALIPDRALGRPGQLVYLPNKGQHYEFHMHRGQAVALTPDNPVIIRREENRARLEAAQKFARKERERRPVLGAQGSDISPVDHFNQSHNVADLLARYRYSQAGQSPDWRSPMQTSGSYATKNFGDYWVSLSASDAAAGIGRATPDGHRFGDAFDLYVHHEKGGDFTSAVRDYAHEAGLRPHPEPAGAAQPQDTEPDTSPDDDDELTDEDAAPEKPTSDWPFKVTKNGVWKRSDKMDKETGRIITKWVPICSELHVLAETRDADGEEWGRLLDVVDRDGRRKRWAMPMALMAGDGSAIRDRLYSLGLVPSQARDARQALLEYIGSAQPEQKMRCVSRIGWSGGAFVLPSQTIGTF
ncbi:DUF927 domain-containing protein [Paracoccus sp. YIM 132242]|uniref:DUF927 domain-containing protein n=1 Tax=Paracoccus lichenicola TaxID=2665644 RepID=A0A6L6HL25_9RHOB|nr:DUF927 domain-containing protein [Paracoccus lichenicola]MTD99855.1 DUF927 domain-containing protein [Paracoccus lichenicola]